MNISDDVQHKIDIIDGWLAKLGIDRLLNNSYLGIDEEYSSKHSVRFTAEPNGKNFIPFDLYIESDAIRIDVLGIPESFEWNNETLQNDAGSVKTFLVGLLTHFCLFEFCGSPHTNSRLYFFDTGGREIQEYRIRGWQNLFARWNCDRHLYQPAFSRAKKPAAKKFILAKQLK